MEITRPLASRYVLVRVAGEVDLVSAPQFAEALQDATATGVSGDPPTELVVDLSEVRLFAAAGVHCLEEVPAVAAHGRCRMCLVCPDHGAAWRILSLLGLEYRWTVHCDLAGALAGIT